VKNQEYRLASGLELTQPKHLPGKSIFVISDLHLNHEKIILYCKRPFDTVEEMNAVLINNWNYTVKPTDLVFFLGDMAMGNSDGFIDKLNGDIFFLKGNHDKSMDPGSLHDSIFFEHRGIKFLFIHDPMDATNVDDEWIIHGHHHNNHPRKFPFFCPEMQRVNVSVEMTQYTPVSLDYICNLIKMKNGKKIISL